MSQDRPSFFILSKRDVSAHEVELSAKPEWKKTGLILFFF